MSKTSQDGYQPASSGNPSAGNASRPEDRSRFNSRRLPLLLLMVLPLWLGGGGALLWTVPMMLVAALFLTWGAEVLQFSMAPGLVLALLAAVQTLPEFAVEAVLAWRGQVTLLLAGLTGAIRLLIGLGWPLVVWTAARRRRAAHRPAALAASADRFWNYTLHIERIPRGTMLAWSVVLGYGLFIGLRLQLNAFDGVVLCLLYGVYLWRLRHGAVRHSSEAVQLDPIPAGLLRSPYRVAWVAALFLFGILAFYIAPAPFLDALIALAGGLGISAFVSIQVLAPLVSEFPEQLSSYFLATRPGRASIGLLNLVASNVNQWSLLLGMLPLVYSLSPHGAHWGTIPFDREQLAEWWLTLAQSGLAFALLLRGRVTVRNAGILFSLWLFQLASSLRVSVFADEVRWASVGIYAAWMLGVALRWYRVRRRTAAA